MLQYTIHTLHSRLATTSAVSHISNADCPYLIFSVGPDGWVADSQIMTQVSDAFNRSSIADREINSLHAFDLTSS
jgi:hypothetical protein